MIAYLASGCMRGAKFPGPRNLGRRFGVLDLAETAAQFVWHFLINSAKALGLGLGLSYMVGHVAVPDRTNGQY